MQRILFNFYLAIESLGMNKLRALLTALGIVFGVGAVIAMLAIGNGAKQSILEQMKLIGTNNIEITAVMPSSGEEGDSESQEEKTPWSPGLTMEDLRAIQRTIPSIEAVSPEIVVNTNIVRDGRLERGKCVGVRNDFFELNNLEIGTGKLFNDAQIEDAKAVCIIGQNIKMRFFAQENPIGQRIKCGKTWFTVIGVLQNRIANQDNLQALGIRDYNDDIFVPVSTLLVRLKNRATITKDDLGERRGDDNAPLENYHQLDRAVLRVADSKLLQATANVVARVLNRRHHEVSDFEVKVPELLLQQQQKTQDTFNFVLAVIAGISLLVGGIGIMNIMLASVLERIKEIGLRRSLGATQSDIIWQFVFEAVAISLLGGIIGIILGVSSAKLIASKADIPTVVSAWSIILAFGVAATVGFIFGLYPAQKAAREDPIKALRTD